MKKYFCLLLLLPLFFSCSEDEMLMGTTFFSNDLYLDVRMTFLSKEKVSLSVLEDYDPYDRNKKRAVVAERILNYSRGDMSSGEIYIEIEIPGSLANQSWDDVLPCVYNKKEKQIECVNERPITLYMMNEMTGYTLVLFFGADSRTVHFVRM